MNTKHILTTICLGLLLGGCSHPGSPGSPAAAQQAPLVKVSKVTKTSDTGGLRYSASVEPYTQVNLIFNSSGYVHTITEISDTSGEKRWVDAGDPIHRGEVLAELRSEEFRANVAKADASLGQAQAQVADAQGTIHGAQASTAQARAGVREAEASLTQARANVKNLQANLGAARAQLTAAEAQALKDRLAFERATALFASQSMTKPEYDQDKASNDSSIAKVKQCQDQVKSAQAQLAESIAQFRQAEAKVTQSRAQVESGLAQEERAQASLSAAESQVHGATGSVEQANVQLGDISLRSPLDGIILQRKVEIGQQVSPGTTGFQVADTHNVRVTFGVPDTVVKALKLGQPMNVTCEALPGQTFHGQIVTIAPQADPQSLVYKIQVKVPNPHNQLKVTMTVVLDLSTSAIRANPIELPTVPQKAILKDPLDPNGATVMIVEDAGGKKTARQRRVKLGGVVGDSIQIKEGLTGTETVVVEGAQQVTDGQAVQVKE